MSERERYPDRGYATPARDPQWDKPDASGRIGPPTPLLERAINASDNNLKLLGDANERLERIADRIFGPVPVDREGPEVTPSPGNQGDSLMLSQEREAGQVCKLLRTISRLEGI
jgi:hypothetical protein